MKYMNTSHPNVYYLILLQHHYHHHNYYYHHYHYYYRYHYYHHHYHYHYRYHYHHHYYYHQFISDGNSNCETGTAPIHIHQKLPGNNVVFLFVVIMEAVRLIKIATKTHNMLKRDYMGRELKIFWHFKNIVAANTLIYLCKLFISA